MADKQFTFDGFKGPPKSSPDVHLYDSPQGPPKNPKMIGKGNQPPRDKRR